MCKCETKPAPTTPILTFFIFISPFFLYGFLCVMRSLFATAKIDIEHLLILGYLFTLPGNNHFTNSENIGVVGDRQSQLGILLNQKNGCTLLVDFDNLVNDG